MWNNFDTKVKNCFSVDSSEKLLKAYLFRKAYYLRINLSIITVLLCLLLKQCFFCIFLLRFMCVSTHFQNFSYIFICLSVVVLYLNVIYDV